MHSSSGNRQFIGDILTSTVLRAINACMMLEKKKNIFIYNFIRRIDPRLILLKFEKHSLKFIHIENCIFAYIKNSDLSLSMRVS